MTTWFASGGGFIRNTYDIRTISVDIISSTAQGTAFSVQEVE